MRAPFSWVFRISKGILCKSSGEERQDLLCKGEVDLLQLGEHKQDI